MKNKKTESVENFSLQDFEELLDISLDNLEKQAAEAPEPAADSIESVLNENVEKIIADLEDLTAEEIDSSLPKTETETTPVPVPEDNSDDRDVLGSKGKYLVLITDPKTEKELLVYGSAAVAAIKEGLNPTTVRSYCKKETIDKKGRQWKYELNDKNSK